MRRTKRERSNTMKRLPHRLLPLEQLVLQLLQRVLEAVRHTRLVAFLERGGMHAILGIRFLAAHLLEAVRATLHALQHTVVVLVRAHAAALHRDRVLLKMSADLLRVLRHALLVARARYGEAGAVVDVRLAGAVGLQALRL